MSLYYDGNMVSGVNFTPQLTLAEYNALSVKPTYWIRTDAPEDYGRLPASEVGYNNTTSGLTADDVQDAVDELKDKIDTNANDIANLTNIKYMKLSTDATTGTSANYLGYYGATIYPSALSGINVNKIVGVLIRSVSLAGYTDIVLFTQYYNSITGLAKAANTSIHFDITVLYVD